MRQVPFYANHQDGMRCMLAVYRSVIDYFQHRRMSWDELVDFTGYEPGRAAWTVKPLVHFAAMNYDVRMIEAFDYRRYAREGAVCLHEHYPDERVQWYMDKTNILDIAPQIPAFLESVGYEHRSPRLADIDDMLQEGRLVFVTVNGRALDGKEGFSSHAILVLDKVDDEYVVHDPGCDADSGQSNHRLAAETLWQAMGGEDSRSEVTGFKLKERHNMRLDQYVIKEKPLLSRAYAVRLIEEGRVLVNGQKGKPGYKLRTYDTVTIDYDESESPEIPDIDLPVLYEDEDCIVINKPSGVLTHGVGKLNDEATVASFLRSRYKEPADHVTEGQGIRNARVNIENMRIGIVHRLDRVTSGVIICAKHPQALAWLQSQFHDRKAQKVYAAIVAGQMDPAEAVIDMPIERNPKAPATFRVGANGKNAVTHYKTLEADGKYSLLELMPRTGRTHQLRVHLSHQNHPIVGDFMYGGAKADRLYLHALSLTLTLPNGELKSFTAELPDEFTKKLESGKA